MFKFIKKDPKDILIPIIPFIFFGSSARALVDNGIYPLIHLLVTPGIYVFTGLVTIATILTSVYLEKKIYIDYKYIIFAVGVIICIPNIININHLNSTVILEVIGIWVIISLIFLLIGQKWSLLKDKFNFSALSAHLFDATTTFVAVDFYGYGEQHVLPSTLTNITGTAFVMYPLKITVILLALYVIDIYIEDRTVKNTLKLAIFILGLAPGLRNFLSLSMGT